VLRISTQCKSTLERSNHHPDDDDDDDGCNDDDDDDDNNDDDDGFQVKTVLSMYQKHKVSVGSLTGQVKKI